MLRLTARRAGGEGRGLPDSVSVPPPLAARFLGPPAVTTRTDGGEEASRELEVTLPPGRDVGAKRHDLFLRWPGGAEQTHPISWRVAPCIEAIPAGFVLRASEGNAERVIRLVSHDWPFRVLGYTSLTASSGIALPSQPSASHTIQVRLASDEVADGEPSNLAFQTDHPHQPPIVVSAVWLGSQQRVEGAGP